MRRRLKAGDLVEVRPVHEIKATLDGRGCLDNLPFMPEMLALSGRRFKVSKRAHKTCDTVNYTGGRGLENCVHLEDLRCDGSRHDGCKARCLLFWKEAWLKPVTQSATDASRISPPDFDEWLQGLTRMVETDGSIIYRCQATALFDASAPLEWWDIRQYIEDVTSRNVRFGHMLRVSFFHGLHRLMGIGVGYRLWRTIYDYLQPRIGGFRYPFRAGTLPADAPTPTSTLDLQPGERVRIKSHESILATLDQRKRNRGMRFDEEMVPYCGKLATVADRVDRIIHERTGQMIEMKSPSVILEGVVCRSEVSSCRLFCPRAIPSYWREIWLERV